VAYAQRRTLRLEAPRSWQTLNLAELWEYRELLFFFVWRDVKVRYKQTVLGALWAIVQPLTATFAFAILFGRLGGMSQHVDRPYALHVFAGMLPWTFLANSVTVAANSLVGSGHLISKVYFPRLLVPLSGIASGLIDFAIAFVVLLLMMAIYGVAPTQSILAAPLFLAGTIIAAAGAGILFAALVVTFRDVRYIITFAVQLWLFASPVLYSIEMIPARWRLLYAINPMAGLVTGFRACVVGGPAPSDVILVSSASAVVLFLVAVRYFVQVERRFADVI